jgi:hypothetical protein
MNIFANIVFIFLYLIVILYLNVPNIKNNKWILHKLVLFIAIFCFQFFLEIIHKIKINCKIDTDKIARSAFETALYAVIGYSIYTDLHGNNEIIDPKQRFLYAATIITIVVTFIKVFILIFKSHDDKCIKFSNV